MSTSTGKSVWYPRSVVKMQACWDDGSGRSILSGDMRSSLFEVKANNWRVAMNSHRKADEFTVEFHERDVPLSPTILRSANFDVHLGAVKSSSAKLEATAETLQIRGHMDEPSERRGEDGQTVNFAGRDETALFLDAKWPRNLTVALGKPLDQVFRDILSMKITSAASGLPVGSDAFPAVKDFPVVWDPRGSTVGRTTRYNASQSPQAPNLGAKKKARRDAATGPFHEENLWEVLYGLALLAGLVVELRPLDGESCIILRPPDTLTPIAGEGTEYTFLYGKNLSSLEVKREAAMGTATANVSVDCIIDGKVESATWPDPPVATDWDAKGKPTEKRFIHFTVSGMKSTSALQDIAKLLWYQGARKEAVFTFATKDMESWEGHDLTRLRPGAAVRLGIDPDDLSYYANLTPGGRTKRLVALGYDPEVADEIARAWDLVTSQPALFFLDELTVNWSNTDGVRFEGRAVNFLGDVAGAPRPTLQQGAL